MSTTDAGPCLRRPLTSRVRRSVCVAVVASILAGGVACACARADEATVFGVNANRVFNDGLPESSVDTQLAAIAASGLTAVRTDAMWAFIEPWAAGNGALGPLYAETDRRMLALARHRLRWLPVLDYSPGWQQTVPGDDHSAPSDPAAFARFATMFAARYGRAGAFWTSIPSCRTCPFRHMRSGTRRTLRASGGRTPNPTATPTSTCGPAPPSRRSIPQPASLWEASATRATAS
jgi:hypothetical protein